MLQVSCRSCMLHSSNFHHHNLTMPTAYRKFIKSSLDRDSRDLCSFSRRSAFKPASAY